MAENRRGQKIQFTSTSSQQSYPINPVVDEFTVDVIQTHGDLQTKMRLCLEVFKFA